MISTYFEAHKRLKRDDNSASPSNFHPDSSSSPQLLEQVPPSVSSQPQLGEEQKLRMALSKAAAAAIRNTRLCESNVDECKAQGRAYPELKRLLVEESWKEVVGAEMEKKYMHELERMLEQEAVAGFPIYPPSPFLFHALNACPFHSLRVLILGQDPYHAPSQAMGLCFSVNKGIKFPSSLANIFKELHNDLGCPIPSHGNLQKWAHQGVLLLNTVLTVRGGKANSHARKGWEEFTDAVIREVAQRRTGVVFLLWGNSAQEKTKLIDTKKHHILKAAHPSGLSAHRGFFGCRHFSRTNQILQKQGLLPIDWQL